MPLKRKVPGTDEEHIVRQPGTFRGVDYCGCGAGAGCDCVVA